MKYLKYLKYILIHKFYVMIECFKRGLIWRGLIHDLSKFLPDEFISYARHFYGSKEKEKQYKKISETKGCYIKGDDSGDEDFDRSWLKHIHRNKHHWQHWILIQDEDEDLVLKMPHIYLIEMICDWRGAGKAQGRKFKSELKQWYEAHKVKMRLHERTRLNVEYLLRCKEANKRYFV